MNVINRKIINEFSSYFSVNKTFYNFTKDKFNVFNKNNNLKQYFSTNRDIMVKDRENEIKENLKNIVKASKEVNGTFKDFDLENKTLVKFYVKKIQKIKKSEDILERIRLEQRLQLGKAKKMEQTLHFVKSAKIPLALYGIIIGFFYFLYYISVEFNLVDWCEVNYNLMEIEENKTK